MARTANGAVETARAPRHSPLWRGRSFFMLQCEVVALWKMFARGEEKTASVPFGCWPYVSHRADPAARGLLHRFDGVRLVVGQLILDGLGDANAVWIFKSATSITPIGGSVVMAGDGTACNVYWQASTLVSLSNTDFLGNILAGTAVSLTGVGSTLTGRAFGNTGVTMTGGADISIGNCGPTDRIFADGFE
jgi:hypothetical protein